MVHSHCFDFANPIYLVLVIVLSDLMADPKYYLLAVKLFSHALSVQNIIYSFYFRTKRSIPAHFRFVVELVQSNTITTNALIMSK
jgi:hypothetical protein